MNIADIIIVSVVLVSILISLLRGFLKEFISLFIWMLGIWVAMKFYQDFAVFLDPYIKSVAVRQIASFAVIFFVVLIIGMLFNYAVSLLVTKTGLSGTDRILGMLFGGMRGVLLISVVLLLISATTFVEDTWWKESNLIPHFKPLVDWLRTFLPEKMTGIVASIKVT